LLVLGSMLASMPMGRVLGTFRLWVLSAVRLFLMPGILAALLTALGVDHLLVSVAVILIAMPVAVNGSMMCMEFGGDAETMASGIFLSTVLCILTIPVVAAVFL
jgi:predicted permease